MKNLIEREPGRIWIVGHRGAEALAPENTWAALEAGYWAGADLLEVDVQLSRDGRAILFHDFTLQPKLGDPRWVRDLTWEQLRTLDVGRWFSPRFAGQRIPLMAEVLDWARDRVWLWLDLKHGFVAPDDDRLERTALELVGAVGMAERIVISSWDQVALARIKAWRPEIPLAVNLRPRVPDPVEEVRRAGADWVVVYWPQTDRHAVAQLQAAGLTVVLAGLFGAQYAEARRLGVDALMAQEPAAARAALAQGQS